MPGYTEIAYLRYPATVLVWDVLTCEYLLPYFSAGPAQIFADPVPVIWTADRPVWRQDCDDPYQRFDEKYCRRVAPAWVKKRSDPIGVAPPAVV